MSGTYRPPAGAILIETAMTIAAPVERIWSILTAFDAYGGWNSYMLRVDGVAAAGARLLVRSRDVGSGQEMDHPVEVAALAPFAMHWVGGIGDLSAFRGDHFFELDPSGPAATVFRHFEYFRGQNADELLSRFGASIKCNFEAFNECLRREAEGVLGMRSKA
jgi:hypothetical protein